MTLLPDVELEQRRLVYWLEIGPGNQSLAHAHGRREVRGGGRRPPTGRPPGAQMSWREYGVYWIACTEDGVNGRSY